MTIRLSWPAAAALLSFALLCRAQVNGIFSKAQFDRGARTYGTHCASCHGAQLEGGDHAPSLKDDGFWQNWNGQPARALYSRIVSSMPPDDPASIPEKDVIDIVAYLMASSGASPGDKEIDRAGRLNAIRLERPH